MIWESVGLMTALDLIIIGMCIAFARVFGRNLSRARAKGFLGVAAGLSGFGLFCTADLFTMWVLPQLTTSQYATAVMESLHLNYHWGVMLLGVTCMLWGFGAVGQDLIAEITERRKAEEALRESQERFELASEGANAGMWDWPDVSQDGQWWSPRWYQLLGYADGEVEASFTNFKAFLHPDDRHSLAQAFTVHLQDRRTCQVLNLRVLGDRALSSSNVIGRWMAIDISRLLECDQSRRSFSVHSSKPMPPSPILAVT